MGWLLGGVFSLNSGLQPGEGFSGWGEAGQAAHQYRSFLEPGSERLAEQVALRITSIHLEVRTSAVRTGSARSVLAVSISGPYLSKVYSLSDLK